MKNSTQSLSNLYLLNCALLLTHEVDSGYWQEWNLFGIPGGNQVFLLLNFILIVVALYGLKQVDTASGMAILFSFLLAAGGAFAFLIHMMFIVLGHREFTEPVSLIVLGALLIVSLMQAKATYEQRQRFQ